MDGHGVVVLWWKCTKDFRFGSAVHGLVPAGSSGLWGLGLGSWGLGLVLLGGGGLKERGRREGYRLLGRCGSRADRQERAGSRVLTLRVLQRLLHYYSVLSEGSRIIWIHSTLLSPCFTPCALHTDSASPISTPPPRTYKCPTHRFPPQPPTTCYHFLPGTTYSAIPDTFHILKRHSSRPHLDPGSRAYWYHRAERSK